MTAITERGRSMMHEFTLSSVLHATDFSPSSEVATEYAALLAQAFDARLDLLHAHRMELPPYFTPEQNDELERQLAGAQETIMDSLRALVAAHVPSDVRTELLVADEFPTEAILETATERQSSLVVLGSHGRTGIPRMLLGSVSENVLREIQVPLLITRHPETDAAVTSPPDITHILCSIDYTPHSLRAVEVAASLAGRLGARLTVLHALERGGDEASERDRVCSWLPGSIEAACDWQVTVAHGNPAEQIVSAALNDGADMIVVGGLRRSFFKASVLGSTTERVVRHAHCPVLTVVSE